MPKKGERTVVKSCGCGCGQQVEPYISRRTGRVVYYPGYVPGHGYKAAGARRRKDHEPEREEIQVVAPVDKEERRRIQPGSKREREDGYVEIKVGWGQRGWVPEHRWLMEQKVGRPLRRDEHVHHIDHVRDNNDLSNLELLSAKEHLRMHATVEGWSKKHDCCVECGRTDTPHAANGLCRCCYQREKRLPGAFPLKRPVAPSGSGEPSVD